MEDSWTPSNSRTSPIPPSRRTAPVQAENSFSAIIEDDDDDDEQQPPIVTPTVTGNRTPTNVSTSTWVSIDSEANSPISSINRTVTATASASPPSPPTALALPNNDYDDDYELELLTMPSSTPESSEYFAGLEITMIPRPNYLIVRKLRVAMCGRLSEQPYENVRGGLSVIGENTDQQRKRRGIPAANTTFVTVVQPTPTLPVPTDPQHAAKKITYAIETTKNKVWVTVTSQGLKILCVALPELTAMMDPTTQSFPISFTLVQAFEWCENRYKDAEAAGTACNVLLQKVRTETFTIGDRGMLIFFNTLAGYKSDIDIYNEIPGVNDPITYTQLVTIAQRASFRCGIKLDAVREVEGQWNTIMTNQQYDETSIWEPFKAHYDTKLRQKFRDYGIDPNRLPTPPASANLGARLATIETGHAALREENRILQANNATLEANQLTLQRNQQELASTTTTVPCVVRTGPSDGTTTTGTDALTIVTTKPWRQWTFFCFTCGLTLHHDSKNHTIRWGQKRTGHDENLDATVNDLRGGNGTRNWLNGLYCSPVNNKAYDKPNGTIVERPAKG